MERLKFNCRYLFIGVVLLSLVGCGNDPEVLSCDGSRDLKFGTFQVTWFTQPVRDWSNHGGAIFGNDSGTIKAPGPPRSGNYCIENKTLYFQTTKTDMRSNEVTYHGIEVIEILFTDGETMQLEFADGTVFTYYNPPVTEANLKGLDELLKKAKKRPVQSDQ